MNTNTCEPTRQRGRPRLPEGTAKRTLAAFKLSEEEDKAIREAAEARGQDRTEWMRERLLEAAGFKKAA